jgi:hypothetical protein
LPPNTSKRCFRTWRQTSPRVNRRRTGATLEILLHCVREEVEGLVRDWDEMAVWWGELQGEEGDLLHRALIDPPRSTGDRGYRRSPSTASSKREGSTDPTTRRCLDRRSGRDSPSTLLSARLRLFAGQSLARFAWRPLRITRNPHNRFRGVRAPARAQLLLASTQPDPHSRASGNPLRQVPAPPTRSDLQDHVSALQQASLCYGSWQPWSCCGARTRSRA